MSIHDVVEVQKLISRTQDLHSDMAYIIVRDAERNVICHTYDGPLPGDLAEFPYEDEDVEWFRVLDAGRDGLIFEGARPIVKSYAGFLQIGLSDLPIREQLRSLNKSIVRALAISVLLGFGLAILLSYVLTQPIRHLQEAADKIQNGDFDARAEIFSRDEIGELANAFNEMAYSLNQYRIEVDEKEEARETLIERIVNSHEDERKLIARELHDQLGQSLLAMLMEIRSLCSDKGSAHAFCGKHEADIEKIMDELSRIIKGLRPTILDDYGLDKALASYTKELSEHFSIDISYKYTAPKGLPRLPDHEEVTLYRVAQESMTNIVKHAGSEHVSVILIRSKEDTTLLIEDDGDGFDQSVAGSSGGLGLMGMRERMSLIGGTLDVDTEPGHGTTIQARILTGVHADWKI
jgi:signal transduction histidine kinase